MHPHNYIIRVNTHQNTLCFSLSRQPESPRGAFSISSHPRLARSAEPSHATLGGDVPGVESRERRACVLRGMSASQAASPGLGSAAAGACARAACCTAHPYCNLTPPCDVLAAPVTSGLRVLPTDPPTPPYPTPGYQEVLRWPAWTNHGSREALTSPETRRGRSEGRRRLS